MRIALDDLVPWLFGGLFVLLFVLLVMAKTAEAEKCEAAGGKLLSKTSLGVGPSLSGSGGVAVVPTTVSFCVSPDGRILF